MICSPTRAGSASSSAAIRKPRLREAAVAGQGVTEVTDADQGDRPALGEPEHLLDLLDQQRDVVADAPGAVRAEVGEVLAELGGVDPGGRGQPLAGDRLVPGVGEVVQRAQVLREPSDGRLRQVRKVAVAPLAMLVDHIGGVVNHLRRGAGEWTVSSELAVEFAPDAAEAIAAAAEFPVVGMARPFGAKGGTALALCALSVRDVVVATATVRSFYIAAPATLFAWPEVGGGAPQGRPLADLMAVEVAETGSAGSAFAQADDPVLNNAVGAVHGGVSSMGLELVGSAAVHRAAGGPFHTASLRVNFLRPFHGGGEARYTARAVHAGRGSGVAEAAAVGADGRTALLARFTAYR